MVYWMELIDFAIWHCPLTLSANVWRAFTRFPFQFRLPSNPTISPFQSFAWVMLDVTHAFGGRCFQVQNNKFNFNWVFHRQRLARFFNRRRLREANQMQLDIGLFLFWLSSPFLRIHRIIHISSEIWCIVFPLRIDRFAILHCDSLNIPASSA